MLRSVFPIPLAGMAFALGCFTHFTNTPPAPSTDLASVAEGPSLADEPVIAEPGEPSLGAQSVTRAPDGLFYIHARVNGRRLRFIVDSGANMVILTSADARAIGAAPRAGRIDGMVDTAAGSNPMAWTTLRDVNVAGQRVRHIRAAVVRRGLAVSLMGQNLLSRLGPLKIEGDHLEFTPAPRQGDVIA